MRHVHRHGRHRVRASRGRKHKSPKNSHIRVALAGNANVGKSVIFNELTGLHQHVGNWPGKTIERAEGTLGFKGYLIDVIDLPGIYSLSTYSLEELVSREYIAVDQPDVLVNVVDASSLERNLFFTLQLMDLRPRMIMALNQVDIAEKKGISIDYDKLSQELGFDVVPTVAIKGTGLEDLMSRIIDVTESEHKIISPISFGTEIENGIKEVIEVLQGYESPYPIRWIAIKLLEKDSEIEDRVYSSMPTIKETVESVARAMEEIHGHDTPSIIASERYSIASSIASRVVTYNLPKTSPKDLLEEITSHSVFGYVFMIVVIASVFFGIFTFGDYMTGIMGSFFEALKQIYYLKIGTGTFQTFIWKGVIEGLVAGITIALPYIIPFYFALSILEDSGYLA